VTSTVTQEDRKRWLAAAIDVARIAGARADHWYAKRADLVVEEKGAQDYVSMADKKTEELIREELHARFPDHAFLGEESVASFDAAANSGKPVWVVDPIDGTTNFLRGVPMWAVSIGLVVDNEPEVGVIVCPRQDEVFAAARGEGATLDNVKIVPSKTTALAKAQIGLGSSGRTQMDHVIAVQTQLTRNGADVRRFGSACIQMAYVACGRLDGYLELHLNAWDVAAGLVIMREAGAMTNDYARGNWLVDGNALVCGAPGVFTELSRATSA
jgi:myo-inositol-1(or 4)-monophosphatase